MLARISAGVVLGMLALGIVGCASSTRPQTVTVPQSPVTVEGENRTAGWSVEGRPIDYRVMGDGDHSILLIGTIHGDESAGTPLLDALGERLRQQPALCLDRRVVLVPAANPDGLMNDDRHNARGVDLNRNFPAPNWHRASIHGESPASEPETRALMRIIAEFAPDRIVTIHQPLACIDYDGPGQELAHSMGEVSDLQVRKLGARPGSLGSYAGEHLGIPTITLELPPNANRLDADRLLDAYGPELFAAIEAPWGGALVQSDDNSKTTTDAK